MFSVIVPCYNQAQYLNEALDSVFNQSFADWECIIVNDGSPDKTNEVAKIWLEKDKRFRYLNIENGGLSNARNAGIEEAKGDYILPLDADDRIGKSYLKLAAERFEGNDNLKLVYCNAKKFGSVNEDWELPTYTLTDLAKGNMIFCSSVFKRSDWKRVGGYDVNMIHGWEDWEFWISLLKDGGEVHKLDEVCFFYRIKEDSMLKNMDVSKQKQMFNYMSEKHLHFYIEKVGSFIELSQESSKYKDKIERLTKRINNKKELSAFSHFKKAVKLILGKTGNS